jgi:hypothetical protein
MVSAAQDRLVRLSLVLGMHLSGPENSAEYLVSTHLYVSGAVRVGEDATFDLQWAEFIE